MTIFNHSNIGKRLTSFFFIIFCLPSCFLFSQWDIDTLQVSFPQQIDSSLKSDLPVRVYDKRAGPLDVIGMYERNKYLLIPVDLEIQLSNPLSETIQKLFTKPVSDAPSGFILTVHNFELKVKSGSLIYPRFQLNACIRAYRKSEGDSTYLGEWVYETTCRKPFFGGNLRKGFGFVLEKWQHEFLLDWESNPQLKIDNKNLPISRYRPWIYSGKPIHMLASGEVSVGSGFFTTDFSIYFSERSGCNPSIRSGGYHLRFRKEDDFDAVEFGLTIDRWIFRKYPSWTFQIQSGLFLGLNQWQDISKREHEIYDALLAEAALSQALLYHPLDRRAVILGIGLSQNLNYIYSKDLRFQFGVLIHLGIQL